MIVNKFKNLFLSIIMMLSLSTVIVLFVLQDDQFSLFFEDLLSNVSLMLRRIDITNLNRQFKNGGSVIVEVSDMKIYFFDFVCMLFDDFMLICEYCRTFFLDQFKKKNNDKEHSLIHRLMYQSDLLHSEFMSTITVLELGKNKNDQVYWVIQLGALRNFQKVLEVVNKLKIFNYPVYILPEHGQEGGLTRIFVGPYSSKEHLECLLDDLYNISMLRGEIYLY